MFQSQLVCWLLRHFLLIHRFFWRLSALMMFSQETVSADWTLNVVLTWATGAGVRTHLQETSQVPRPRTGRAGTWARCRWRPGLWWWTRTLVPAAGRFFCPGPEPWAWRTAAVPDPASWWRERLRSPRQQQRWTLLLHHSGHTSPVCHLYQRLSVAVGAEGTR